jgi:predicted N-acyltransferase
MDLPGTNVESYFDALSRTKRHNFRKKLRRSKDELELVTTFVKRPNDVELAELFALFMQTYEKGKTKFEKLSIEFFRKIRETEPAWFILQRDKSNGKLLTFMLVFKLGDRIVNKFIGLEYGRAGSTFLYFRQFEEALKFAYENGMTEFQSGQTGYRAKLDLGHDLVSLHNYCHHSNVLLNAVYSTVARDITWSTLDSDLLTFLAAHKDKTTQVPGPQT